MRRFCIGPLTQHQRFTPRPHLLRELSSKRVCRRSSEEHGIEPPRGRPQRAQMRARFDAPCAGSVDTEVLLPRGAGLFTNAEVLDDESSIEERFGVFWIEPQRVVGVRESLR